MAGPIFCDNHLNGGEQVEASFMLSDLDQGSSSALCGECFLGFALALVTKALPPEQVLEAVGPIHVAKAAERQEKVAAGKKGKRSAAAATEPGPEPEPDQAKEDAAQT